MRNADAEGRVTSDEATARRRELVASKVAAAGDAIVEELIGDEYDTVELPDGRLIIRAGGMPAYVADVSSLDVDAWLVLDEEDELLDSPVHATTEALREALRELAEWIDGSPESGPREVDEDEAAWARAISDELQRREDDAAPCGHGTQLDRDCFGELRCVECDGPCPGCYDGPGPDADDELRCPRCDRDELLYPSHPDATSSRVVCLRCDIELDA